MIISFEATPDAATRKLLAGLVASVAQIQTTLAAIQAAQAASANQAAATKEAIMASIDDIIADVTEETTTIGSLDTAIKGLQQMLADALANETIPPAVQAKIDSVFATVEANKAALAQAMTDSVPPSPPPAA